MGKEDQAALLNRDSKSEQASVEIEKRNVRSNGFDLPLNPLQIISWLVFGYDIVVFFFLNLSLIEVPMFFIIILAGCYAVLAIGVFVLAYLATSTDPTDPTIKA